MSDGDENPVIATWRSIPPLGRDILVAVLVIVVLLGSLWGFTGQPVGSAPLVVVESGSMMHPDVSFGRFGTIDPGDLILVRNVDADEAKAGVVTRYGAVASGGGHPGDGTREAYGHPGDVIIFSQDECSGPGKPPIIHRAMTWVEVHEDGTFSYHDETGAWRERQDSVDLSDARLDKDSFETSGWVTQGDNPTTNRQADQAGICNNRLVEPEWLVGKARGEIPWLGLLKFMLAGNTVGHNADWCTVFKAHAPCDLFTMLWVTIGVIIAIPLAWDLSSRFLRKGGEGGGGGGGGEAPAQPERDSESTVRIHNDPNRPHDTQRSSPTSGPYEDPGAQGDQETGGDDPVIRHDR